MKKNNRKVLKQKKQSTKPARRLFKKRSFVPNRKNFPWLKYLIIFLLFSLAIFFRIYKISEIPPSLNWDEVSHGYNAYSIFKTGKDEWGISWPLIFRAYGDYKLPLYIYLTAPVVGFGGINPLTVRLVSILSGLGVVATAYLITKRITRNEGASLFAAFLAAISPWSLFVSRVALEANLAAFLFSLAIYFWLNWVENLKEKDLIWSGFFWGLSLYAYNSARVLVPFFVLLTVFFVIKKRIKFLHTIAFFLLILIFYFPLISQLVNKSALARFDNVFLIDQGLVNQIVEFRNNTHLPSVIARLIYNRPSFFVYYSFRNYLYNLSPWYLFFRGGSHYQFSLPDHEILYLVTAPFLLIGIIKILLRGSVQERCLLFWFFVGFIPSAITKDAPHVLRTLLILPAPLVLSAIGLKTVDDFWKEKSFFKGKLLVSVLWLSVLVSFGRWWLDYQNIYPKAYSWAWQYGYKEAVEFVKENYQKYDKIFFTKRYGEPHEFVLAYFQWPPEDYQLSPNKNWNYHANWYWIDGFDKFVFVNDWEIKNVKCQMSNVKCLLITSPGNYPEGWNKIKTINFLDGREAFEILEN